MPTFQDFLKPKKEAVSSALQRRIISSNAFPILHASALRLRVYALTGTTVLLEFMTCLKDGTPQYHLENYTPSGNPLLVPIPEGYLLYGKVSCPILSGIRRGDVYVILDMVENYESTNPVVTAVFVQHYISSISGAMFPGQNSIEDSMSGECNSVSINVSNPGAGTDFSYAVPANQVWKMIGITFTLQTAVAVANREPRVLFGRAGSTVNVIAGTQYDVVQAASLTQRYIFSAGAKTYNTSSQGDNEAALPYPVFLYPTDIIFSKIGAIQGADQLSAIYFAYERYITL